MTNTTVILTGDLATIRAYCRAMGFKSTSVFKRTSLPPGAWRLVRPDLGGRRPIVVSGEPLGAADVARGVSLWRVGWLNATPHAVHVCGHPESLHQLAWKRLRLKPVTFGELAP